MSKYSGIPCTHCGHPFEENDDIVVCPECGAPSHRSCYREAGRCALSEQHAPGFAWQLPAADPKVKGGTVVCPSCNAVNPKQVGFCQMCGARLEEPPAERFGGRMPFGDRADAQQERGRIDAVEQWEVNGVSARELSAYTGNSAFYFLRQFQMLLRTKFNISWNWSAFLFNFLYFFYRRMYLLGGILMAFFVITDLPSVFYSMEFLKMSWIPQVFGVTVPYDAALMAQMESMIPMINVMRMIVSSFCALFANKMFLKKALEDVATIRTSGGNPEDGRDYYAALYQQGRPNRVAVIALIAL
ncbi:MAG: RING finger protein, partial [Oscillospiraceae bacterium]